MTCFDTAYVVKCYVKEHGWQQVRALARSSERLACSAFGRLEFHAALHRKLREGKLDETQLDVILRQLNVDEADKFGVRLRVDGATVLTPETVMPPSPAV